MGNRFAGSPFSFRAEMTQISPAKALPETKPMERPLVVAPFAVTRLAFAVMGNLAGEEMIVLCEEMTP